MAKNPKSKSGNSSSSSSEVIVVGGGAMGSATAYELARRGLKTRLFEQYLMGHDLGSSHGYSRIIRRDYYEHPDYVPLVDRAYELWRDLEKKSGESLLTVTGILGIGKPGGEYLKGSELSCKLHKIPHERLTAKQIRKRFPQFNPTDDFEGVFQPDGGILAIERCILTYRSEIRKLGGLIHEDEEVLSIEPQRGGKSFRVRTRHGEYTAERVVICAGPWAGRVLASLKLPLEVERQTLGFYTPLKRAPFELGRMPVFFFDLGDSDYYGFPFFGIDCVKVARHHGGAVVKPESVERNFTDADNQQLLRFLKQYMPLAAGTMRLGKVCLYTNTPDKDFILDRHPEFENMSIASGFSGHGFKFASSVGEVMAELATKGKTRHAIGRFRIDRFGL
jgi:sarcosine oxidase